MRYWPTGCRSSNPGFTKNVAFVGSIPDCQYLFFGSDGICVSTGLTSASGCGITAINLGNPSPADSRNAVLSGHGSLAALDQAVGKAAEENEQERAFTDDPAARARPSTSMAFELALAGLSRLSHGQQVASYVGLISREYSSGGHQRLDRTPL